ncbi:MAG: hypothetical protein ATN36_08135 [Epulopiscium sp. Nele67-Bin005]|nr:MAG: hypothetical protein ATN36_08135 [Epulopiscium sp. Nele67-Bin005]
MATLKEIFSIYFIIGVLGIGVYMSCLESITLKNVDHLNREASFTKVFGIMYIVVAIVGVIVNICL